MGSEWVRSGFGVGFEVVYEANPSPESSGKVGAGQLS